MFTIYLTNTFYNGAEYIVKQLSKVDKTNLDIRHIVLVPDHSSLESERALLSKLTGSFNAEVLTIRRFANRILPKLQYLSKQAGILALSGIVADSKDNFVCYKKGIEGNGFIENLYEVISQLKYSGISPEQLTTASVPPNLKGKITDIAQIYKLYQAYLSGRYVDSAGKLEALVSCISTSELVNRSYFYLYDFDNFSAQEFSLISELVKYSLGVTVACCYSDNPSQKYLYQNDIYDGLISIANNLGITPLIERENSYKNAMSRQIGENLYCRYTTVPIQSDAVELFSASTRKEEVYHLAEKISDYTRLGGRYKDVFVITSDITKYADSIATIFPQFDIPFFCDLKTNLSDHIFSRYIIDYLTLFKNNFRREDTLHFVKNYLFAHSPTPPTNALPSADSYDEDVFVFENYCLKYNINYDFREFSLCAQGDEEMLKRAESVRARFFNLYSAVTFPSSDKVSAYCERIYTLIAQGGVLQNLADLIELQGKNEYSKTSAQVYEKFCAVLTQLSTILGERFVTLDSFIKSLTNTLASVQISVVPIVNDCVVFANMAKARKHDIIYLALLGCNHAVMPIVKQDVKLLSDNNIRQLAEVHIDLQPQISLENKRERFSLYQLLQEPSARLYVSYATSDNNDTLLPSSIVSELSKMFTSKGKPLSIGQTVGNEIYTRKQALSTIVSQTRRLADMLPVKTPYFNLLTDIFASELSVYTANNYNMDNITCGNQLFFADTYTSVTKIEDYFICPYKSYLSYGLSLKEREVAELKPSVFGNILHAILENYLSAFALPESDITTRNRATASFNYVMSLDYNRVLNESKELAHILRALQAEAISLCFELKHQLENSRFVPYGLEQKFGYDESSAIVINVGDKQLRLKGKIDRIDIHNNNFIILDYKSGRAEYNENMLYMGKKLQLLIYTKATEKLTGKVPVGFYYFKLHDNFQKDDNSPKYQYVGRTLNNSEIIGDIDSTFASCGESARLGIKKNKKGEISSTNLITSEQLDAEIRYALSLVSIAGKKMQEGFISASPLENACSYCQYADICSFGDLITTPARCINKTVNASIIESIVNGESNNE